jgi:hypothetical protein
MRARELLALVLALESIRLEIRGLDMIPPKDAERNRSEADKNASEALQLVRALAEQEER